MSDYYIGPEGPLTAELACVAEKPGKDELASLLQYGKGRPLIGASGRAVDTHLIKAGTFRHQVYLTNTVKHFSQLGNPTDEDIKREQPELYKELSSLPNLKCILALGQAALLSLTNFHYSDITSRRGSVLETSLGVKIIPTFHPAYYMNTGDWRMKSIVDFDFKRAVIQSKFSEIHRPKRTFEIMPTLREAYLLCEDAKRAKWISFDIENCRRTKYIYCISFSTRPDKAFCLPIMHTNRQPYWEPEQEAQIWRMIQAVLSQPQATYVTQNGLFDCWHLWRHGVETPYMATGFDTMYAHRLIAPDLPHDLGFLVSLYTEEPYYKDESGSQEDYFVRAPDEKFYTYNCKDSSCTLEVARNQIEDMKEAGLYEYYIRRMHPRWNILSDMRKQGMKVDTAKLIEVRNKVSKERQLVEDKLKNTLGWIPNTKSYIDMGKVFDTLHVDYDKTPTGRPKANEEKILTYIYHKNKEGNSHAVSILANCLEITRRRTIESSFLGLTLDKDNYYHPSYDLSKTKSGRDSSEGEELGGPQAQNIPHSIRSLFIADADSHEVTECDLKQAETTLVAYFADELLILDALSKGKKIYNVIGSILYRGWNSSGLPPDDILDSIRKVCDNCQKDNQNECNHSEYYMSKQGRLAFGYGMGIQRFIREQAKKNLFVQYEEAKRIRLLIVNRELRAWYERTMLQLRKRPVLENPLGRIREFYGLPDDEMTREALSWLASSTVSCIIEIAEQRLYNALPQEDRIMTQTHDSLTLSHLKSHRQQINKLLETAFYVPMTIHGRKLVIPIDITHGPSWGEQI